MLHWPSPFTSPNTDGCVLVLALFQLIGEPLAGANSTTPVAMNVTTSRVLGGLPTTPMASFMPGWKLLMHWPPNSMPSLSGSSVASEKSTRELVNALGSGVVGNGPGAAD